ncbi:phytoene desaturase family protein [Paenibacillus abyssi]|uniref:Amine oxidase n=1 Tax=Paenibacillus abyssi TaxID=1340531 RepID=A0A917D1B3_9BACL|nr:FAD-dependent oxidoreductase [Paenibacillus abyssi]GGG05838.1 amine oxidase [Paenibacillus abyssi]
MNRSVGIIGAGIGGLTAAVYLAQSGFEVTLLEKAVLPGGNASSYIRRNRMFPTGATVAFGLEPGGILSELLMEMNVEIPCRPMFHSMDVVLSDRKVSIYADRTRWEEELSAVFHERADRVSAFWKELSRIAEAVMAVTSSRVALPLRGVYQLGKLPRLAVSRPGMLFRLLPYSLRTVESLLRKHGLADYAPFRAFLDAQLVDAAQTDASNAALLPSALALDIYRYGIFAVEGGFGTLIRQLEERFIRLGGRVLYASPVTDLRWEGRRWQAHTERDSFHFDWVINATGLTWNGAALQESGNNEGWGAFRIDAIVRSELLDDVLALQQEAALPFACQIMPMEHAASSLLEAGGHGPVYVTFHPSRDAAGRSLPDEAMVSISVHTRPERWTQLNKEDYRNRKRKMTEALFDEMERLWPAFRTRLIRFDAGSPRTYARFVGKSAVGGYPLTVRNAILKPSGSRTSHSRLILAGDTVFPGPGTLSSALSGYYAARAIMRHR